jgi:excisionase family DNA binding protein
MTSPNKILLTTTEASKIMGLSRNTVVRWADTGIIPCLKPGYTRYIPRKALEQTIGRLGMQAMKVRSREG